MITSIFDKTIAKILTLFAVSPGSKFTRNEIKKKTMLNNLPLDKALNCLAKEGIIKKEKRLLRLDFEDERSKKVLELVKREYVKFKEIPLNIYYVLADISSMLVNYAEHAYLFGSYAKLIYTEKSDIDLAIILKKGSAAAKKIKSEIVKLEKKYGKTIEGHFFSQEDLKQKDPLVKEIRRNSIVLF